MVTKQTQKICVWAMMRKNEIGVSGIDKIDKQFALKTGL
jgi:hypothetical protein